MAGAYGGGQAEVNPGEPVEFSFLNGVDPGLEVTQHIIQFVLKDSQTILSFIEPFPELKTWFESIIDHIDESDKMHLQKNVLK